MPVLLRKKATCLFIHIPKTGGTSFENLAEQGGWTKVFSVNGIRPARLHFMKSSPQHYHAALLKQVFNLPRFDDILVLVRDPVARMKSEFYWQTKSKMTELTPEDWIADSKRLLQSDPFACDNHLRPQVEFIPDGVEVQLFKLEEDGVARALKRLFTHGGAKRRSTLPELAAAKASRYRDEVEAVFHAHDAEIRELYRSDCDHLGYPG